MVKPSRRNAVRLQILQQKSPIGVDEDSNAAGDKNDLLVVSSDDDATRIFGRSGSGGGERPEAQ